MKEETVFEWCLTLVVAFLLGGAVGAFSADRGRSEQARIATALESIAASVGK